MLTVIDPPEPNVQSAGCSSPSPLVDDAFTRALDLLEGSPYALDLARTRLAFGGRLRRAGRRREARVQLQAAIEAFEAAGAMST
jgi:hypothetical protein